MSVCVSDLFYLHFRVFEDGLIAFKGLFEISYNHVKKYGYFYYKYVVTKGAEFEHICSCTAAISSVMQCKNLQSWVNLSHVSSPT